MQSQRTPRGFPEGPRRPLSKAQMLQRLALAKHHLTLVIDEPASSGAFEGLDKALECIGRAQDELGEWDD